MAKSRDEFSWYQASLAASAAGMTVGALRALLHRLRGYDFYDRVVLISGASRGLGLILARQLAARGARLALCARSRDSLDRVVQELEARGAEVFADVCDISDRDQVRRFVAEVRDFYGGIDVLVNNASIIQVGPHEVMSEDDFKSAMDVNFWGGVHFTYEVLPSMRERRQGLIINVTSIGGKVPVPHLLPYTAAKFATVGFSEGLHAEVAQYGVRVLTVVPGLMRTGSFVNALFKGKREKEVNWFSLGATLPGVSMDAERAARQIIRAAEQGKSFVTLGMPAKALRMFHALTPGVTSSLFGLVNRILPKGDGIAQTQDAEPGHQHRAGIARTKITVLGDRAAEKFREQK